MCLSAELGRSLLISRAEALEKPGNVVWECEEAPPGSGGPYGLLHGGTSGLTAILHPRARGCVKAWDHRCEF